MSSPASGFGLRFRLRFVSARLRAPADPSGFEYYTNPSARTSGHITWVADGVKSWTMYPAAVGPNADSQVSQRLISEEPMAMVRADGGTFVATGG